jgi:hypothetical protein
MPDFNRIYLYRMTHIGNIPHILANGITHIASANANAAYVPIGDGSLINRRTQIALPNGRLLSDYIPFYFGGRMPMLLVIQHGTNGVTITPPEDIVYCITTVAQIIANGIDYFFTDGHAVATISAIYAPTQIDDIEDLVDFNAVRVKYWRNDNDLDLKRRMEAEFLVGSDIPAQTIVGYVVYNEVAKNRLVEMGIPQNKILIKRECYF